MSNWWSLTESPFYKEHFATNQKSLSLPVQKLWPIMWFSLIFLKSRDVQRWRRTSKHRVSCRSGILQGTFSNQPEASTTSSSKVMAHYVIFTKVVTLTLIFIRFSPKKICQGPWNWVHQLSKFQKDWTTGVACTSRNYGQTNTDRQTDRQTDKPRWPIYFAKIYDFAK